MSVFKCVCTLVCVSLYTPMHQCHGMCVEVIGHLEGVVHQAWWQVLLPHEATLMDMPCQTAQFQALLFCV